MLFYIPYIFFSTFLFFLLHLIKPFNKKIRLHLNQEKRSIRNAVTAVSKIDRDKKKIILFHAASAGEYEQLKPILKKLNRDKFFIVQSFTSPTIYQNEVNSGLFDVCCYHPFDVWWQSHYFFKSIKPDIYCITRHDIWPGHLWIAEKLKIRSLYINVNIHNNSIWVKPLIRLMTKIIFKNISLFTIPSQSIYDKLLGIVPENKMIIIPDTRFDQVIERVEENISKEYLPNNYLSSFNIIFGSYDNQDEGYIFSSIKDIYRNKKDSLDKLNHNIILVPHETDEATIERTQKNLDSMDLAYSLYSKMNSDLQERILIVDKVGILADLYKYCTLAYVGSGFSDGVHSVIEPGVYGCVVGFGPNIELLDEAKSIHKNNLGIMIHNKSDMVNFLSLYGKKETIQTLGNGIKNYIMGNRKSSDRIIEIMDKVL